MSRIGKQPVSLPSGVTLQVEGDVITVTGPKGTLTVPLYAGISLQMEAETAVLSRENDDYQATHGLVRSLLQNAVVGVSNGWTRILEINGVGLRAALAGSTLNLNLGFSHPVSFPAPEGIAFQVVKNTITISGIDKQLVGETAANIRKLKEPEPYKGKGIKYSDEQIRRKSGKTGTKK